MTESKPIETPPLISFLVYRQACFNMTNLFFISDRVFARLRYSHIHVFLFTFTCVLLGGMGLGHAENSEKLKSCYGAERFGNGNVRIEFQFPNCKVAQKSRVLMIQSEYIKFCYIPNYKNILGMSFNESEVAQLRLDVNYPDMSPAKFLQQENYNIISINLSTKGCDGRDDFNPDDLIKKAVLKESAEGKPLYSEEEILSSGMKKYKALTKTIYHESDIYLMPDIQSQRNVIIRCKQEICKAEGAPFLDGYYLSYTFNYKHLNDVKKMDKRIKKFVMEKFDNSY